MNLRLLITFAAALIFGVPAHAQFFRQGPTRSLTSVSNIIAKGYLSLSSATNRLEVTDGALTLDGEPVGGGGDSLWESDDGVITPSSDIGGLHLVSTNANEASTAPILTLETEEFHDTSANTAEVLKNGGTNSLVITPWGSIAVGRHFADYWGDYKGFVLSTALDVDDDLLNFGSNGNIIEMFTGKPLDTQQPFSDIGMQAPIGNAKFFTFDNRGNRLSMGLLNTVDGPAIEGQASNVVVFAMSPTITPSGSAIAYELGTATVLGAGDRILGLGNGGTNLFFVTHTGAIITQGGTASTPANASASGTAGEILWDSGFLYVCVANNTWKRVAIATW